MAVKNTLNKIKATNDNRESKEAFVPPLLDEIPHLGWSDSVKSDYRRAIADVSSFISEVFQDGQVTQQESSALQSNRDAVMYDFLLSVEIYNQMQYSKKYTQSALDRARYIMTQMKVARDISYAAIQKAPSYKEQPLNEKNRRRQREKNKEVIELALSSSEVFFLQGITASAVELAYQQDQEIAKKDPLFKAKMQKRNLIMQKIMTDAVTKVNIPRQFLKGYVAQYQNG